MGCPYLKCSLKFDWGETRDEDAKELLNRLKTFFLDKKFARPMTSQEGSKEERKEKRRRAREERKNLNIEERPLFVGLNEVFRAMRRGLVKTVIIDSNALKPSAVNTAIGLYCTNHSSTVATYALKGLNELAPSLGLRALSAIAIAPSEDLHELIASKLRPVSLLKKNRKSGTNFSPALVELSVGKKDKKGIQKKKKKKLKQ